MAENNLPKENQILVEVAYAKPDVQVIIPLTVELGTTLVYWTVFLKSISIKIKLGFSVSWQKKMSCYAKKIGLKFTGH